MPKLVFGFLLSPTYEIDLANERFGPLDTPNDPDDREYVTEVTKRFDIIWDEILRALRKIHRGVIRRNVWTSKGMDEVGFVVGLAEAATWADARAMKPPENLNQVVAQFQEVLGIENGPRWYVRECD